jgi:MFS family permease
MSIGLGSLAPFIGIMIALGGTPWLVENLGFQSMILIYGIMGIAGTLASLIFIKSEPPTPVRAAEIHDQISGWQGIKNILKMRQFLILGFFAFLGIGVFNGLLTWFEQIMHDLHGIAMTDAGSISTLLLFSGMIGCISMPIISDKVRKRKIFLILITVIGIAGMSIMIFANGYAMNLINGMILGFFMISALPIMYTMSTEITGPRYAGISVGYLQLLGNVSTIITTMVIESLARTTGSFAASLAFEVAFLLAALVMSIIIKETYQRV